MEASDLGEPQLARENEIRALDQTLPSDAFSDDVRKTLYKFALIRNSWGTTNIDAGPINLERVAELYDAFRAGITPAGRVLPTEIEVLNYFALIDNLPSEPFEVGLDDVRQLHRDYFRNVSLENDAVPGQFKRVNNVVNGPFGTLETSPVDRVESDLQDLLDWLNGEGRDLATVGRAAIFFHEFQRIHPFADGNGRVGRLATLAVLRTGGLSSIRYCPLDDAINEDREEYYLALRRADTGDLPYWVGWFTAAVHDGYRRSHRLAQRLQSIPPSVPDGSQRLLEWTYIHRVRSFKTADTRPFFVGLSKATITRRLGQLEDLGFIEGRGRGAGRSYEVAFPHEILSGRGGA